VAEIVASETSSYAFTRGASCELDIVSTSVNAYTSSGIVIETGKPALASAQPLVHCFLGIKHPLVSAYVNIYSKQNLQIFYVTITLRLCYGGGPVRMGVCWAEVTVMLTAFCSDLVLCSPCESAFPYFIQDGYSPFQTAEHKKSKRFLSFPIFYFANTRLLSGERANYVL